MDYSVIRQVNGTDFGGALYPPVAPTSDHPSGYISLDLNQPVATVSKIDRRKVVIAVRLSFFLGAAFVLAIFVGFWAGGIWMGLVFVPGFVAAYGLFLTSGKQLELIDTPLNVKLSYTSVSGRYAA